MNPGVYDDISNADYHQGPGESKSLLDLVRRSPAHYRARKLQANDNHEATAAQKIGTAFHALLLEPAEFVRTYCLALRPQDVQSDRPLVESRDQLVAMVEELNKGRLPKLSTSGAKDEMVTRVLVECERVNGVAVTQEGRERVASLKLAELKGELEKFNCDRQGLLSVTGTMEVLALTLSDAGRPVTLWSDVKADWLRNNSERIVLTQDEWDQLHRMRDAVMAHPAARALMTGAPGVAEHSVYWRDEWHTNSEGERARGTGLLCRCRPDFWRVDGVIVDVKTTDDASPEGFARSIAKWRYHVQATYYLDGIAAMQNRADDVPEYARAAPKAFVFLAVEKSACVVEGLALGVGVYVLDGESMQLGRAEYQQDLARIAECAASGRWPGYGDKIESISLPRWKLAQGSDLIANAA